MKTYFMASAGCPRRAVDSQKIADYLETNNLEFTQDFKQADLYNHGYYELQPQRMGLRVFRRDFYVLW